MVKILLYKNLIEKKPEIIVVEFYKITISSIYLIVMKKGLVSQSTLEIFKMFVYLKNML